MDEKTPIYIEISDSDDTEASKQDISATLSFSEDNSSVGDDLDQLAEEIKDLKVEKAHSLHVSQAAIRQVRTLIRRACRVHFRGSYGDYLVEWKGYRVKCNDVKALISGGWLNDEIINAYFSAICSKLPKVYAFNSFFYSKLFQMDKRYDYSKVKRWTKNVRLDEYNHIIIPINIDNSHWVCAGIDLNNGLIIGYDSLYSDSRMQPVLKNLKKYLSDECRDKNLDVSINDFSFEYGNKFPQQNDGSSCGVFVCLYGLYQAAGLEFDFNKSAMMGFRWAIAYDLLKPAIKIRKT